MANSNFGKQVAPMGKTRATWSASKAGRGTNGQSRGGGAAFNGGKNPKGQSMFAHGKNTPTGWGMSHEGRGSNGLPVHGMKPKGSIDRGRVMSSYGPTAQQGARSGMDPSVKITYHG